MTLTRIARSCFVVGLASLQAIAGEPTATPTVPPGHLYDRVAVIGASASDGFGVIVKDEPAPTDGRAATVQLGLAKILRLAAAKAAAKAAAAPIVHDYASGYFFANPGHVGRGEIDRALKRDPTLVIALDYLFWWVFGTVDAAGEQMSDEDARLKNLEAGLAQLDRLLAAGTPIVVGDLPDMADAIGKMLSKAQVPKPETLAKANARIAEWSAVRSGARHFPLAQIHAALKRGEMISLGGTSWETARWGEFLQRDQLHPTFVGTVALAAGLAERARDFDPASASPWQFDPDAIRTAALTRETAKPGADEPQRKAP